MSDGTEIPTRTVVWCVGVRPDPLVSALGLPTREGRLIVDVAASLGHGEPQSYRHRDMGFVVDLGGWDAVADPLHVPLSGPLAKVVARGYHLWALPSGRLRVATDWVNEALTRRPLVHLGVIPEVGVSLDSADQARVSPPPRSERLE